MLLIIYSIEFQYKKCAYRPKDVRCQVSMRDIPASHGKARDYSDSWGLIFPPFSATTSVRFLEIHSFEQAPPGLIYVKGIAAAASHSTQGNEDQNSDVLNRPLRFLLK